VHVYLLVKVIYKRVSLAYSGVARGGTKVGHSHQSRKKS